MKFSGKAHNGQLNKRLNFGGDPDQGSGYGFGGNPDPDPCRYTGKTCLGEGMHCPSASSSIYFDPKN